MRQTILVEGRASNFGRQNVRNSDGTPERKTVEVHSHGYMRNRCSNALLMRRGPKRQGMRMTDAIEMGIDDRLERYSKRMSK